MKYSILAAISVVAVGVGCGDDETAAGQGGSSSSTASTGGSSTTSVGGNGPGGSGTGGSATGGSGNGGSGTGGSATGGSGTGGSGNSTMTIVGTACGSSISYTAPMDVNAFYHPSGTDPIHLTVVRDGPDVFDAADFDAWGIYAQTYDVFAGLGYESGSFPTTTGSHVVEALGGWFGAAGMGFVAFDNQSITMDISTLDADNVTMTTVIQVLGYSAAYPPTTASWNECEQGSITWSVDGSWSQGTNVAP